jgi:hypothetical protein
MFDDVLAGLGAQVLANAAVHAVSVIVPFTIPLLAEATCRCGRAGHA